MTAPELPAPEPGSRLTLRQRFDRFLSAWFDSAETRDGMWRNRAKVAELATDRDRMRRDMDAQGRNFSQHLEASRRDVALEIDQLRRDLDQLRRDSDQQSAALHQLLKNQQDQLVRLKADNAQFSRAYSELTRRVDAAFYRRLAAARGEQGTAASRSAPSDAPIVGGDGLEALLAAFHNTMQDRFRGSREEVKRRLLKYLGDVRAVVALTGKPLIDLGAGRGEWLELLAEEGIAAQGVDANPVQVSEAANSDVVIQQDDVCSYLAKQPPASVGVISALHLVEHLPFNTLVWMVRESMRVLAPGGLLLLETPNPRNVLVGATSFHTDPTHIKPLPAEVLQTLVESVGFHPVEVRFLHPHEKLEVFLREGRLDPEVAYLLFGAQDTAVLGRKPALRDSELA